MNRAKAVTIGIIILLFIIILLQNTEEVTINIFFWEIDIALYYVPILMAACFGLGIVAAKFWGRTGKKDEYDIF